MFFGFKELSSKRGLQRLLSSCAVFTMGASYAVGQDAAPLPPLLVEGGTLEAKSKVKAKTTAYSPAAAPGAATTDTAPAQGQAAGTTDAVLGDSAATSDTTEGEDGSGGVAARKIATPISVVTGAELRARQIRNAADALRSLPGVAVSATGGSGNLTQVRIRGAEGNHTLVIIDGVEANDTNNGEFDFSNLSADEIERIEVIRGAQSGLYGSRAIGGVINIITTGGKGPLTVRASAEGGSFNTKGFSGSVSKGTDNYYFALSGSRKETDGFNLAPKGNEDDGYTRTTFNFRTGARLLKDVSVDFNLRHSETIAQYDTFDGPLNVAQTALDAPLESDADVWLGGGKLTWSTFDGGLTHVFGANFNRSTFTSEDVTDPSVFDNSTYDNQRDRFYYLTTARFATPGLGLKNTLSGLVEKEDETFTPKVFFTDGDERSRERTAFAAEYRGEFLYRFFPIASIRHDDNDTFADFTTWKTGLSVDIHEIGIRPHASVGTAVALPGMFEQFGSILGTFVGNPNLVPEESFGWDAGAEFTLLHGNAAIDITYFNADLKNEIAGFGNTVVNLFGESQRQGIEVASRWKVMTGVALGASYTYLDASGPDGQEEVRRPPHAGKIDVNYVFADGRGNLNVAAIYNGQTKDIQFFNRPAPVFFSSAVTTLDDYLLVNVAASYKLTPEVEVFGRIENLLNDNYQEVFGYETAGTTAYAGLRFAFDAEKSITSPGLK